MNLLKRKPVGRPGGHRSTLVIYVDCDEEDFAWVQKNCVKAVEDYLDEAFSQMMVFPEGDIQLFWLRAAGLSETGRTTDARPETSSVGGDDRLNRPARTA